jgi:hypothetical protein
VWSRLAYFDRAKLRLVSADGGDFELAAHSVDNEIGRLICWINFGVGCEYLVRGICLIHGRKVINNPKRPVLKPPSIGTNMRKWAPMVQSEVAPTEKQVEFIMLAPLADHARTLVADPNDATFVWASLKLLAAAVRNRDAHRYVRGIRASQFHGVADLFVPALNILMTTLDCSDLTIALDAPQLV